MANNNKTFVRISNLEVYNKLEAQEEALNQFKIDNGKQHQKIIVLISQYNSQVSRFKWVVTGCVGLTSAVFIALITLL